MLELDQNRGLNNPGMWQNLSCQQCYVRIHLSQNIQSECDKLVG